MSSTHSFDGKRVAISGRFSNTAPLFTRELEALGARVTKSISTSTDYLITGARPSDTAHDRAQRFGVVVLLEAEARVAMAGEAIEVSRPGEGGSRSMDELLGEARSLTARPPCPQVWRELLLLCDECDITQLAELTHYIQAHTSQWGMTQMRGKYGTAQLGVESEIPSHIVSHRDLYFEELRVAPSTWAGELLRGMSSPKFALIHALSLEGSSASISKALHNPHLTSVTHLHVHAKPAPTARLNTLLCDPSLLEPLTHFSLGSLTRETIEHMASHTQPMSLTTLDMSGFTLQNSRQAHEIHARLLDVPFFSTVRELIVRGPCDGVRRMSHLRSKSGAWPDLRILRLRHQRGFKGTHLRNFIINGMLEGVTLLDLGNVPLTRGPLEIPWYNVCKNELPHCITSLDLSHMARALSRVPQPYGDAETQRMITELFEGRILTHITHVLLGEASQNPRFTEAFDDARPDITLIGSDQT